MEQLGTLSAEETKHHNQIRKPIKTIPSEESLRKGKRLFLNHLS